MSGLLNFFKKDEPKFNVVSLKANLKMCVQRIRMQQNKRVNSVKKQRRELAELLNVNKLDAARIRVEAIIREDLSIEGLELLALFTDLLTTRLQVLAESSRCPTDLKEAVTSVLWASGRVDDIPEFKAVRQQFGAKYGKPFMEMAMGNTEMSVNDKLVEKISVSVPTHDHCVAYLQQVADEYGLEVDFSSLEGPQSIVSATVPADVYGAAASGEGIRASTGVIIPPILVPKDELEARLLSLKRQ